MKLMCVEGWSPRRIELNRETTAQGEREKKKDILLIKNVSLKIIKTENKSKSLLTQINFQIGWYKRVGRFSDVVF